MAVEFTIDISQVLAKVNGTIQQFYPVVERAMRFGTELYLGEFEKKQLRIVDGTVGPHGGKGTTRRTTDYGLRRVTGNLARSFRGPRENNAAKISTSAKYAAAHQFGYKQIPKRLYLYEEFETRGKELIITQVEKAIQKLLNK